MRDTNPIGRDDLGAPLSRETEINICTWFGMITWESIDTYGYAVGIV